MGYPVWVLRTLSPAAEIRDSSLGAFPSLVPSFSGCASRAEERVGSCSYSGSHALNVADWCFVLISLPGLHHHQELLLSPRSCSSSLLAQHGFCEWLDNQWESPCLQAVNI